MKIVHILPALTKGGAERVAVDLANAAAAEGHTVSFVLAYPVEPALLQDRLDPRIHIRFVRRTPSRLGSYWSIGPWLVANGRWLLGQDLIHCHLTFGSILASLMYRMRRGNRPAIVETYHAVGMEIPGWNRQIARALMRNRDAIALMADDSFWSRYRLDHPEREIRLIPNGVSAPHSPSAAAVTAYRRAVGIPDDVRLIGSVGRLLRERRPDALLEAFAAAAARLPENVHLVLGGEGPERTALAARAEALGLADRVHLPGLVRNPAEAFALMELYLTVNVGPITGIAALEAAMSGLPVIAFQMLADHEPDSGDWIWSSGDVARIAEQIVELTENPDAAMELSSRQQVYARDHHSLTAMARAYSNLYQIAVASAAESN